MTKIIYKKRYGATPDTEGGIILKEISGIGTSEVEFHLEELPTGYLTVEGLRAKASMGVARLNLSELADGLYTPIYLAGTKALLCSPFIKRGDVLIRPLPDGGDISRLEILISALEERVSALADQCLELRSQIGGEPLKL